MPKLGDVGLEPTVWTGYPCTLLRRMCLNQIAPISHNYSVLGKSRIELPQS